MADFAAFADRLRQLHNAKHAALVVLERVGSTHSLGQQILEEYSASKARLPGMNLVAWQQLSGRGRQDRHWASPPGQGIYCTLLRELPDAQVLQGLPLATAVALCAHLRSFLGDRCGLKWPNDVMVDGLKLGGILIEAKTTTQRPRAAISFGINHGALESFAEPGAISIKNAVSASESNHSRPALADLASQLMAVVEGAHQNPPDQDLIARYRRFSVHQLGDWLTCRRADEVIAGNLLGFDDRGFIRLQVHDQEVCISAGEVMDG